MNAIMGAFYGKTQIRIFETKKGFFILGGQI